ncbi:HGxxPAAW family protein [Brachybacterium sp. AOP25-B2-12]|uniref:HGxxPAAW family protein n=1 Tax=Brachybacterium sp. AOP25-B2-12 TaxID=3457710 RepID=UPI0040345961
MSKTYSVPPAPPQNHGKTVAAWVMFLGVVIGATIVALAMVIGQPVLIPIGLAVAVVLLVVSLVLRLSGFGQRSRRAQAASR